mmetsp:Transcript_37172/g.91115  ORF Transcript_37172/g.91115 Transcript_37172/m.91115 type:complete len:236 (+) Transcript_37172:2068-2775(+)
MPAIFGVADSVYVPLPLSFTLASTTPTFSLCRASSLSGISCASRRWPPRRSVAPVSWFTSWHCTRTLLPACVPHKPLPANTATGISSLNTARSTPSISLSSLSMLAEPPATRILSVTAASCAVSTLCASICAIMRRYMRMPAVAPIVLATTVFAVLLLASFFAVGPNFSSFSLRLRSSSSAIWRLVTSLTITVSRRLRLFCRCSLSATTCCRSTISFFSSSISRSRAATRSFSFS